MSVVMGCYIYYQYATLVILSRWCQWHIPIANRIEKFSDKVDHGRFSVIRFHRRHTSIYKDLWPVHSDILALCGEGIIWRRKIDR